MIIIYTTFPNKKSAEKAMAVILKNKLAGCINAWPIKAQYLWKGKMAKTKEYTLIIKTVKNNYQKIEKIIKRSNPHGIPAILSWPVSQVEKNYLKWLKNEIA